MTESYRIFRDLSGKYFVGDVVFFCDLMGFECWFHGFYDSMGSNRRI